MKTARVIPLDYRDLAWWAETADGYRDEELVIAEVKDKGEITRVVKQKAEAQKEGNHVLVDGIYTGKDDQPLRPPPTSITVRVKGKKINCRSKAGIVCDSIFCTNSAIEKFLFLYYRAQRLLTPEEWEALMNAFRNAAVLLIGHVWPSRAVPLGETGSAGDSFYILSQTRGKAPLRWESLGEYMRRI